MSNIITPQRLPDKIILPDTTSSVYGASVLSDSFLSKYTPSPHDGRFAVDLLYALQNHLPLTFFQKTFLLVTIGIPGPVDWKLALFNFFYTFSLPYSNIASVLGGIFVIALIYLVWRFLIVKLLRKKEPLAFLELVFPSATSKSAYSMEQFFSLLHSLAGQRSLWDKIIGNKKLYSLEIVASREQGIRYILAIPEKDAFVIEKGLLSFLPGLKINEIKEYLPENLLIKEKIQWSWKPVERAKVIELKLTNDFVLPLKENKALIEHDPIAYITGNMTKLEKNEMMVFQVLASPVLRSSHRSIVRYIEKIEKLIYNNQPLSEIINQSKIAKVLKVLSAIIMGILKFFSAILQFLAGIITTFFDGLNNIENRATRKVIVQATTNRQEILNPYEEELREVIKGKVDQTLFEISLRLLIKTDNQEQAKLRSSGFLASFSSLGSAYQSLVQKSNGLFSFLRSPLRDFTKRQFSFANNPILSVSELTDIYHFPYMDTTKTEDMVKSKSSPLPAPLSFKQTETKFDNVFATNSYGGTETAIGQTLDERRRHTYILGATGSGKTTLLSNMIYSDIVNGKGVAVLDPHGQLIENILRVIPKNRIKDVVWFAPDDDAYPVALNLLELPKNGSLTVSQIQKQKALIASSLISVFQKFYDEKYFGPRMEYVLRNAIFTALETPEPTLRTILDLLTKDSYRKEIIKGLKNEVLRDYWVNEFNNLGSMQKNTVISPITNKIGGLLASPINFWILSHKKSTLNFDDIINSGKILLCDLSKGKIGEDESSFFGSLVIAKIQLAALARVTIPEEERRDFYLYVDEFQNFATESFAELVSEARKYRVSTILAHQSISQIEDRDIVKVILANVGTVICFRTANPEDEQFILPIFSPEVNKHEIGNLLLYNFYIKISVGQAQDSFLAQADNFTVKGDKATASAVIERSRSKYAVVENPVIDDENPEKQMRHVRQKPVAKVSHLVISNETKNEPFQDQKTEKSGPNPIQERSKDGIGIKNNINKQKTQTKSQIQIPTITPQQHQIISTLYRFRFLERTQIQKYLNHKNHKRILIWLNDLTEKKFIKTIDDKKVIKDSKAKIYYLDQNGIKYLATQDGSDKSALEKFHHEKDRTNSFVSRSLLLADICLDLQAKTKDKISFEMFVKSDYPDHQYEELLTNLSPHAYIEEKKTKKIKRYFLEILPNLPVKWLRMRLKKYLKFYQQSIWEAKTGQDFPAVMFVCVDDKQLAYVSKYIKSQLSQLYAPDLTIRLTMIEKVVEFGITGDVWEEV